MRLWRVALAIQTARWADGLFSPIEVRERSHRSLLQRNILVSLDPVLS